MRVYLDNCAYNRPFDDQVYMEAGLRQKDSAHIACAVYGGGDYFITVDRKILNKQIGDITVIDPVDFLRRLQNDG